IALSIAKALTTRQPFVGQFKVPEVRSVLYLVPEVNDRQFNRRARYFGIPDDENLFLVRTLSHGPTLPLSHPHVLTAVKNLHQPVVILDTAIRFSTAQEENSAVDNKWMEDATRGLREAGAIAVILLHHSPKSSVNEYPSLENTFRGSTDIGALFDMAYCIRREPEAAGIQVKVTNVKERDEASPLPFTLGLKYLDNQSGEMRSFVEENGDLAYMEFVPEATTDKDRFVRLVTNNPRLTFKELTDKLGKRHASAVQRLAEKAGWKKSEGGMWLPLNPSERRQTDDLGKQEEFMEPEPF
ncbi:MAG TPA: AAA family ATPase, partial [Nitrososphaera sp.]|nr:AAA family ATPase [Nitrososphaera sp.]